MKNVKQTPTIREQGDIDLGENVKVKSVATGETAVNISQFYFFKKNQINFVYFIIIIIIRLVFCYKMKLLK